MRSSPPRLLLTLALSGIGLVMATGPALAHDDGEGNGHRGKTGRHAFIDSEDKPGARCLYRPLATETDAEVSAVGAKLVGIVARPPKVAAINRTDRIDHQRVGWRFIVQEQIGDGDWTNVRRSALQVGRTSENRAARFGRLAVRVKANPEANYRVVTKAFWFKRRLRRMGMAFHTVDYYAVRKGVTKGSCEGVLPAVEPAP